MLYLKASIMIPFLFDIRMYFTIDTQLQKKLSRTKCCLNSLFIAGFVCMAVIVASFEV
jgi:hypothetical protein